MLLHIQAAHAFFVLILLPLAGAVGFLRQNTAVIGNSSVFHGISINALSFIYDVKELLIIPILYRSRLRSRAFLLKSLMRNFIALLNGGENFIDLFGNQIHFAPQEYEDQEEEEEVDYPENSDNIHRRREGTLSNLRGYRCDNKLCSAKLKRQIYHFLRPEVATEED